MIARRFEGRLVLNRAVPFGLRQPDSDEHAVAPILVRLSIRPIQP